MKGYVLVVPVLESLVKGGLLFTELTNSVDVTNSVLVDFEEVTEVGLDMTLAVPVAIDEALVGNGEGVQVGPWSDSSYVALVENLVPLLMKMVSNVE